MSCRSSRIKVPTTSYTVRPTDTVFSIAAQFNVTPAEVSALNRLSHSSELFPEQIIRVPDLNALAELEAQRQAEREEAAARAKEEAAKNAATSPRAGPGIAARVSPSPTSAHSQPPGFASCSSFSTCSDPAEPAPLSAEESVRERQFVKSEHARLFTDGEGCVSGTLIITPQTLMFDPSLRDRLVQERGQAFFQWQIELRQVRTVAVYSDPRAMRLMVGDSAKLDNPDLDEAELRMELSEQEHRFVVSTDKSEEDKTEAKDEEKEGGGGSKEGETEAKEEEGEKEEGKKEADGDGTSSTIEKQSVVKEPGEAKGDGAEDEPQGDAKEDADEVEVSIEPGDDCEDSNIDSSFEARPAMPSNSQLDYLCILYKPEAPAPTRSRPVSSSSPSSSSSSAAAAVAKQPRLPDRGQHWFTLPHEKSKELLAFLKESSPEELESPAAVPIPVGPNAASSAAGDSYFVLQENHFALTPPPQGEESARSRKLRAIRQQSLDWELINREEVFGAAAAAGGSLVPTPSIDEEMLIPALVGEAKILQEWMLRDIVANLPSRAEGCLTMELAFSTHVHGFSLASLYRKCKREVEEKPCVLLLRSQKCPSDCCFGAVLASGIRVSDHFYGTGETYLMRWTPKFEKFAWSGNNNYIIRCGHKSIMIGSSNGAVGLFIDEGLYRGRSQVCGTFEMPTSLTHDDAEEDFIIDNVEVWNFK